jgi:hypothetical protein
VSDEYPGEEPGTAAPTWAAVPTMPWGQRGPEQRRDEPEPRRRGSREHGPDQGEYEQHGYDGPRAHDDRARGERRRDERGYDDRRARDERGRDDRQGRDDRDRAYGGRGYDDRRERDEHHRRDEPRRGHDDRRDPREFDDRRDPRGYERDPREYDRDPREYERDPRDFDRDPRDYDRRPREDPRGYDDRRGHPDQGGYRDPRDSRDPRGRDPREQGRPGPGTAYGRPRSRALDEPTDEVPRVRRDAPGHPRNPQGSAPAAGRSSGRASVGGVGGVYGSPRNAPISGAPVSSGPLSNAPVSSGPLSNAPVSSGPLSNAPVSSGPLSNAPVSSGPLSGDPLSGPLGNTPLSSPSLSNPPLGNAPVSSGPLSNAPISAAPVSSGPLHQENSFFGAPPAEDLLPEAPVSGAGEAEGSGIRVEFVEAPPPAVASGTAMGTYQSGRVTGAGVDGLQATGYLPIVRPGAEGFPPELAAIAPTSPPGPRAEPAEERGPDPEQVLAGFVWRFDPDTLREQIEGDEVTQLTDIREQLTAKLNKVEDNPTRARLLSLRAVVSRILGDLPKAFADGKLALAHAEATGELRRIAIAQARLAHVLQWREEFEEADRLFTLANSSELPDRLRATMHQHSGRCAYDQGRYMEACNHFERALDLRKEEDPELIAQTELALDAVFRRVAEKGWGPYPRTRDEILKIRKAPSPAFDEQTQRWGYIESDGSFVIGPGYLDVQPFRDGVAWVHRQGAQNWELIDDTGRVLIDPAQGYIGVGSFSDGVAWVSRDGTTRWIAIDKNNAVLISTGYDDVRPFRRGVAAVRRGEHWGAVDGIGRVVVQFQYDGFATSLLDGRYIDGFSDEGLAVISLDGRKGVVDRSGRVVVPPVHHTIMIHPVAFLFVDDSQRWGALDRRGRTIIQPTFASRTGVTDEIDRLLADTRPVM